MTFVHGDCLEVMAAMEPDSVAAVVTDPPYGLEFMGKSWDRLGAVGKGEPSADLGDRLGALPTYNGSANVQCRACGHWPLQGLRMQDWHHEWAAAAFRVAKPGAHLLAFGGTRTYHRMAVAIEDAGWEIRDCLVWAYASGFPKSHNLDGDWQGWGTALKPAWEPIVMARKPLRGTVAVNVAAHGTGALNIDGTRIGTTKDVPASRPAARLASPALGAINTPPEGTGGFDPSLGRWPANVILTDPIFDGGIEGVVGGGEQATHPGTMRADAAPSGFMGDTVRLAGTVLSQADSGTYSRFFLIPKAGRAEREPVGLRGFDGQREQAHRVTGPMDTPYLRGETVRKNTHPTVKPVDLMRHLVRLVTPPGGVVLDPFLGSGTTGIACEMEGFDWIGIEREAEYVAIAEARLRGVQKGMGMVG